MRRPHGGGHLGVPVLLARCEPDDVARPDLLDRTVLALGPAAPRHDDQRLAERMRVPRGACPGFEGDARTSDAGRRGRREQRVNADRAGEPLRGAPAGRLQANSFNLHHSAPQLGWNCPSLGKMESSIHPRGRWNQFHAEKPTADLKRASAAPAFWFRFNAIPFVFATAWRPGWVPHILARGEDPIAPP